MFEEVISTLDQMNVQYTEGEDGSLTISVAEVDKVALIDIINVINNNGMPFTIDESSIVISGAPEMPEEPVEEGMGEMSEMALNEALGM